MQIKHGRISKQQPRRNRNVPKMRSQNHLTRGLNHSSTLFLSRITFIFYYLQSISALPSPPPYTPRGDRDSLLFCFSEETAPLEIRNQKIIVSFGQAVADRLPL